MITFYPTFGHLQSGDTFLNPYGIVFRYTGKSYKLPWEHECQGCKRLIQSMRGVCDHLLSDCAHWRKVDGTP